MAEYYALLSKAVGALKRNDEAARRDIYVKARSALIKQLKAINPPLPAAEISKQRLALEEAIRGVEREAVEAAASAMPSEEEIERQAEQALEAALTGTPDVSPDELVDEGATDLSGPQRGRGAEAEEPLAREPRSPGSEPIAEVVPPPSRSRPIRGRVQSAPGWERSATVTDIEEPAPTPMARPRATPDDQRAARPRSGRRGWERAPKRTPAQRRNFRLTILAVVVIAVGAAGYFGYQEREALSDFIASFLGTDEPRDGVDIPAADAADEVAINEGGGVIPVEDGGADAVGGDVAEAGVAVVADEPPPVVESTAFLYDAAPGVDISAVPRFEAGVEWTLLSDNELGAVIAANIEVPDRGLSITLRIGRSSDEAFSHEVSVLATLAQIDADPLTAIENLSVKSTETSASIALVGSLLATSDFLLIELPVESERGNSERLQNMPWFDLALVYESGQRAVVAFSKGTSGDLAFARAFSQWAAIAAGECAPGAVNCGFGDL